MEKTLNIELLPVEEVLKFRENTGIIALDTPIKLFDGVPPPMPQKAAPAPSAPAVPPPNAVSLPIQPVEKNTSAVFAPPAQPASTGSIELSLSFDTPAPQAHAAAPMPPLPVVAVNEPTQSLQLSIPPAAPKLETSSSAIEISMMNVAPAAPAIAPVPVAAPIAVAPVQVAAAPTPPPEEQVSEAEAAKELPYLFSESGKTSVSMFFSKKVTGAPGVIAPVVDFGSMQGASSSDVETLKNYLTMREQDLAVLKVQHNYARQEISNSQETIKQLTFDNETLRRDVEEMRAKIDRVSLERDTVANGMQADVERSRFEVKSKIDQIKVLEEKLRDADAQQERLKERVRMDIRKIRVRERELESKLEILKRDSETLISSREHKILELKRRIDLLEFNYDMLQERVEAEKATVAKLKAREDQVQKMLRLAQGTLQGEGIADALATQDEDDNDKIRVA